MLFFFKALLCSVIFCDAVFGFKLFVGTRCRLLVCVIICYGRANSVMFTGSSDGCGCQVCGDGTGAEMMVTETGRVRVSYLQLSSTCRTCMGRLN